MENKKDFYIDFRKNEVIPHIIINDKNERRFSQKEELWINKLKKWGLIAAIVLVAGYALIRIITTFF